MGALRCGHATLQRKGSLGAVQHVQICSLSQILDDEFEARQVIERMDGNKAEAEAQDIHLDMTIWQHSKRQLPGMAQVKLDFKVLECVEPALRHLQSVACHELKIMKGNDGTHAYKCMCICVP